MINKINSLLKNKNISLYIIILILGITLMAISGGEKKEKPSQSDEKRIEEILKNTDGIGEAKVYVTFDKSKKGIEAASGAVVLLKNTDSYAIKYSKEIVSDILNIPIHNVMVYKMNK